MNVPVILAGALYVAATVVLYDAFKHSARPSAVVCGAAIGVMILAGLVLGGSI
jgi:hypothetical protein